MSKPAAPFLIGTSAAAMQAQDIHTRIKEGAALAIPAHIMTLMIGHLASRGFAVRRDVIEHLERAVAVALGGLDELSISRAARLTDETATKVLRELQPDDARDALGAVAMMLMVMIDEGLWADAKNQGVLVALLMLEDMKAGGGIWEYREGPLQARGKQLLLLLQREGFYNRRVVDRVGATSSELQA